MSLILNTDPSANEDKVRETDHREVVKGRPQPIFRLLTTPLSISIETELDGAAPQHLEQLPVYDPPATPFPSPSVSTDPAQQPTSTASSSTPRPSEPRPTPTVSTAQPAHVASAVPQSVAANHPAPPQPLPQAIPSDLPPSYDEIR